mgnify:CR=1 FL=1
MEAEVARQREMVLVACESFSDHPDFGKLGFLLTVIIDDLIDAGVRGEGGAQADARVFQLVALLFSSLFRLAAFAPLLALAKEVKQREKKRDKDKRKQYDTGGILLVKNMEIPGRFRGNGRWVPAGRRCPRRSCARARGVWQPCRPAT